MPKGAQALEDLQGLRASELGLTQPVPALSELPLDSAGVVVDPPFPQLFFGMRDWLLCAQDQLWRIDSTWFLSPIPLLDPEGGSGSIVPAGQWHFADAGAFWMLFNGETTVFRVPDAGVYASSKIKINTGCYYRGRMLFGGFSSDAAKTIYGNEWQDMIANETKLLRGELE